jgi:hypothetical protein
MKLFGHLLIATVASQQTQLRRVQEYGARIHAVAAADAGVLSLVTDFARFSLSKRDDARGTFGDWNIQAGNRLTHHGAT